MGFEYFNLKLAKLLNITEIDRVDIMGMVLYESISSLFSISRSPSCNIHTSNTI